MKKIIYISFCSLFILTACNKSEGSGGTSTLYGQVNVQTQNDGRPEITEIIFSTGLSVEHGDYFVINNLPGRTHYYVYYDNPGWVSEANPFLEGRTGIAVSFNYSDSNVEIAAKTESAFITVASGEFEVGRILDIVKFKAKNWGDAPDADKVSSPFEVNTAQQGKSTVNTSFQPAVDEKVYITYGDQLVYSDVARTGGDGDYQFTGLRKGNYTLYAIKTDPTTGIDSKVIQMAEITENKAMIEVADLNISK